MIFNLKQDLEQQSLLYMRDLGGSKALSVERNEHYCWLKINSTVHSVMSVKQPEQLILPHLHAMMLAQYFVPQASSALELGLGGGSIQRYLAHFNPITLTSVDISPDVIACFDHYFNPNQIHGNIIQADALDYLAQAKDIDLLFIDLFAEQHCPEFLFTADFYRCCQECLSANSLLVLNLLPAGEHQVDQVMQLLQQQFGRLPMCFSIPGYINRILMVADRDIPRIRFDQDFFSFVNKMAINLNLFVLDP